MAAMFSPGGAGLRAYYLSSGRGHGVPRHRECQQDADTQGDAVLSVGGAVDAGTGYQIAG